MPGEMGKNLVMAWTPIHCVSVDYEKKFAVNTLEELDSARATVNYNDGTKDIKRIVWAMRIRLFSAMTGEGSPSGRQQSVGRRNYLGYDIF